VGNPDYLGMPGGFLDIEKAVDPDIIFPNEPTTVIYTVTLENVDVVPVRIKSISDWLPSTDNGEQDEAFIYVAESTIINGVPTADDDIELNKSEWEGKKDRWKVEWDLKTEITLLPGEVLTWEFDTTVVSDDPGLTFNELLWDIDVDSGLAEKITLYSFPTAGILVPMYDLEVETLSSTLATNAWLGKGDKISPKSTHWKKHK